MDLALTVTHYPNTRLTFAIIFGRSYQIETEIRARLLHVKDEAAHPMLMAGVFAELERVRHTRLWDELSNQIETEISEIDTPSCSLDGPQGPDAAQWNQGKRSAYLDLTYFKNALVSWNGQLASMVRHSRYLIDDASRNMPKSNEHMPCDPFLEEGFDEVEINDKNEILEHREKMSFLRAEHERIDEEKTLKSFEVSCYHGMPLCREN